VVSISLVTACLPATNMTTHYTPEQLAQIDIKAGWPLPDVAQAVGVQLAESQGNSNEIGWDNNGQTVADTSGLTAYTGAYSSYDTGLFQINSSSDPSGNPSQFDPNWAKQMETPAQNAKQGLSMFQSRGWEPWAGDQSISNGLYDATGQNAVNAATGTQVASQFATTPDGTTGLSPTQTVGSGSPPGAIANSPPTRKLTGIGAVLQGLNGLLNPQATTYGYSLNPLSDISALAKNAASPWIALVETIVVRGGFAVGFGMIAYLGVKTLTGASGSSSGGVVSIIQTQQRNARAAERTTNEANRNKIRAKIADVPLEA